LDDTHIKEGIESKNYKKLPSYMRKACLSLDELAAERQGEKPQNVQTQNATSTDNPHDKKEEGGEPTTKKIGGAVGGREIDIAFGSAMYKDSLCAARLSLRPELISFVKAQIDFSNLSTFIRCKRLKMTIDFSKQMLIDGGKVKISRFEKAYGMDTNDTAQEFKGVYGEAFENMLNGKIHLDTAIDAELIAVAMKKNMTMTSLSPFLGYYFRQLVEYRVTGLILSAIKAGRKSDIEKRIRGLYE
jgi:hypothetical protein